MLRSLGQLRSDERRSARLQVCARRGVGLPPASVQHMFNRLTHMHVRVCGTAVMQRVRREAERADIESNACGTKSGAELVGWGGGREVEEATINRPSSDVLPK